MFEQCFRHVNILLMFKMRITFLKYHNNKCPKDKLFNFTFKYIDDVTR